MPEYRARSFDDRSNSNKNEWGSDTLINFGLRDVEKRLLEITNSIRTGTLEAYSRLSADNLDQLLQLGTVPSSFNADSFDVATLKVVLARLGKANSEIENRIISLLQSREIEQEKYRELRNFLGQLNVVYQTSQQDEKSVEEFVKVINSYWSEKTSEKTFLYDKFLVETNVTNKYTGKKLPLGALSSGEKQIISIFARLYLSKNRKYLILIDEPELSLSIEWQQKFLPDILKANSCLQLIAITHSPFTFANELDPYAGSLEISYIAAPQ